MAMLELGLKFAPTPEQEPDPLEFFQEYVERCTRTYARHALGRPKAPLPQQVMDILEEKKEQLDSLQSHPYRPNLSARELEILDGLRSDKELTIRAADKGSAMVVQDSREYLGVGDAHLSDVETYEKMEYDYSKALAIRINQRLKHFHQKGFLSKFTYDRLRLNPDEILYVLLEEDT